MGLYEVGLFSILLIDFYNGRTPTSFIYIMFMLEDRENYFCFSYQRISGMMKTPMLTTSAQGYKTVVSHLGQNQL